MYSIHNIIVTLNNAWNRIKYDYKIANNTIQSEKICTKNISAVQLHST